MAKKNNNKKKSNGPMQGLNKVFYMTRRLAPRLLAYSGTKNIGYSVLADGLSLEERVKRFATNELLVTTGIDAIGIQNSGRLVWNTKPMALEVLSRVNLSSKAAKLFTEVVNGF